MKTKLLGILALCLGVAYAAQAQFRIGTTDYPTLSAAVACRPHNRNSYDHRSHNESQYDDGCNRKQRPAHRIEKRGRDIYTQTQRSTSYVFDHGTK